MDKQKLFEKISQLTLATEEHLSELRSLQEEMVEVLEENAELEIENQNLREELGKRISKKTLKKHGSTEHGLSKSRKNLEKLYSGGYHVCNEWFGKRRPENEECAFCVTIIYGDR